MRQPWAWAIVHGGKDVENRRRHSRYRGLLLIHASGRTPRAHLDEDLPILGDLIGREPDAIERELVYGAILGAVDLVDTVED